MLVPVIILGFFGLVIGCAETSTKPVPTKEQSKAIAEDMKAAQKERMKAMRGQMKGK